MENNKYYIPLGEELHIGFEYEEARTALNPVEWDKRKIRDLREAHEVGSYLAVRVKYLDREDIESLGWKYIKSENYNSEHHFRTSINSGHERTGHTDWYELKANFWSNATPSVTIRVGRSGHESGVEGFEYQAFNGRIKNISELRKLHQQLGIELLSHENTVK